MPFFCYQTATHKLSPEFFAENTEKFSSFGVGGMGKGWDSDLPSSSVADDSTLYDSQYLMYSEKTVI